MRSSPCAVCVREGTGNRPAPLTPGGIDRVSESAGLQTGEVGANAQSGQATTKVRLDAFGAREMLAIDQVKD